MELNTFWKAFLMICAFTFGWFLCSIEKETNINVLHHGKTILNAGIRIFKEGTYEDNKRTTNRSDPITSKPSLNAQIAIQGNRIPSPANQTISTVKPVSLTIGAKGNSTQTPRTTQSPTTPAPEILQLYARNAKQWTKDEGTCRALPRFTQAVLRSSAGSLPIFIHNPKQDIHVSNSILKHGSWEGGYIELILTFLKQDLDLQFVDLGANVGVYSMAVAKFGRKVLAVDALNINIQRLCATVKLNHFTNNVRLIYNALSDVHETVSLGADKGNVGGTFVAKDKNPNKVRGSRVSGSYGDVQTATLDDLLELPDFDLKKVIIKMDVEGYENRVFRGGEKFFKRVDVRAVLMEWMWLKTGPAGQEIIDFLTRHGFTPTRPVQGRQPLPLKQRLSWPNDVLWRR